MTANRPTKDTSIELSRRALLRSSAVALSTVYSACSSRSRSRVTFGVLAAKTGPRALWGNDLLRGIELAAERANTRGGVHGRQVRLAVMDTQSRDELAAGLTTKLCEREDAAVLFGELSTPSSERAATVAISKSVPFVAVGATSRDVSRVGEFAFRVAPTEQEHALVLVRYLRQTLQKRKVAVVYRRSSILQLQQADAFAEALRRAGGEIVARETFSDIDVDLVGLANQVRSANPDAVFVPCAAADGARVALALRNARVSATILGTDGWRSDAAFSVGAEAVAGVIVTDAFAPTAPRIAIEDFVRAFRDKYRAEPGTFAALGYDSVRWVLTAAMRVPSLEPRSLRDAMAGSQFDDGVTGALVFDPRRALTRPVQLLRIERDRFVYVDAMTPA